MKKILCTIISIALLVCLCGCNNGSPDDDYLSAEIEIVYQEETVYSDDGDTVNSDLQSSQVENVISTLSAFDSVDTSKPNTSSTTSEVQDGV